MKKFFIDSAIYYILISVGIGIISLLTGAFIGLILLRLIASLVLAYVKPLDKLW